MPAPETIEDQIFTILRARNPHVTLTPGMALGSEGLGLDSIAIVEVLLECEEQFGVSIATQMLSAERITVDGLVEQVHSMVKP